MIYFRKICLTLSSRCTQLWHAGQPLSTHQVGPGPLPDVWDQFPIWKTGNFHGKGHKQGQSQFTAHWRSETVASFVKRFLPNLIKKSPWLKHIGWYHFISCLQFDEIQICCMSIFHFSLLNYWFQEYCKKLKLCGWFQICCSLLLYMMKRVSENNIEHNHSKYCNSCIKSWYSSVSSAVS